MGKLPHEKLSFGKMYIWEVATWEIAHFGSCHLGKYPWGNFEYFFSISNLVLSWKLQFAFYFPSGNIPMKEKLLWFWVTPHIKYEFKLRETYAEKKYKKIVSKIRQDKITWDTSVRKKYLKFNALECCVCICTI